MTLILNITENKFNVGSLGKQEAKIMSLFLFSELKRHEEDINDISHIIQFLEKKWNFNVKEEYIYA